MRMPPNGAEKNLNPLGPRGLLSNYPDDVVCIINGLAITKSDVLSGKRELQRRELAAKRRNCEPVSKPCFVETFYVPGFFKRGWHLYVVSLKRSWGITPQRQEAWGITPQRQEVLVLKIMQMFPCGYLPVIENFHRWKATFADHYPAERTDRHGRVIVRAEISPHGRLLDIRRLR